VGKAQIWAGALLAVISGASAGLCGDYVVQITGPAETSVGGTCLTVTSDRNQSHIASGTVPLILHLPGDVVSCAVQKKTGSGSGPIQISIREANGRLVQQSAQTLPFGIVMAGGR
jgi:hypothetical protein